MKVSVIIPAYNMEETLRDAVESAHSQDEVGEVLVVNDGSTDGTKDLCAALERSFAKLRVLRHADGSRRGASASRNVGIQASTCELIAFLDSDDLYTPWRFKASHALLTERNDLDGVYGNTEAFFSSPASTDWWLKTRGSLISGIRRGIAPEALCTHILGTGECFTTNAITIRKSALNEIGGFDESLSMGEDWNLWIRLAMFKRLSHCGDDRSLSKRRVHDRSSIFMNRGTIHLREEIRSLSSLIRISRGMITRTPVLDALAVSISHKINEEALLSGSRFNRLRRFWRFLTLTILTPSLIWRRSWLREMSHC
jgi:glycosyltransferase involved in cell wall biosynthesis